MGRAEFAERFGSDETANGGLRFLLVLWDAGVVARLMPFAPVSVSAPRGHGVDLGDPPNLCDRGRVGVQRRSVFPDRMVSDFDWGMGLLRAPVARNEDAAAMSRVSLCVDLVL